MTSSTPAPVKTPGPMDAATAFAHMGGHRACMVIGGRAAKDATSVTVVFKARARDKINRFVITLENDLYTVDFYKGNGPRLRLVETVEGLYDTALLPTLEKRLGLAFHF